MGADAGQRQLSIAFHGFGNPWKQKKAFYNRRGIWWGWADNDPDRARNTGFARSLDTAGSVLDGLMILIKKVLQIYTRLLNHLDQLIVLQAEEQVGMVLVNTEIEEL